MILGDGYIDNNNYLSIQHSSKQKDYLQYKMNLLNKLEMKISNIYDVSRNGYEAYRQNCREPETFKSLKHQFYPNGNKTVTRHLLNKLDAQGLAIWFMDDGCCIKQYKNGYGNGRYLQLCTNSFSKEENIIIINYFKTVWDIDLKMREVKRKNQKQSFFLIINATNAPKFIDIISPYVIDSMKYKIDFDYYKNEIVSSNEQPKFDLDKWFEGQKDAKVFESPIGENFQTKQKTKVLQLCGIEVVLFENGTYNLSDTSG